MSHDPTRMDTTKQTPSPNKHGGRKVAVIGGAFVLAIGAAIFWAASSEKASDTEPDDMWASPSSTATPSPVKTIDGRYTKYVGTFTPNLQISLRCNNGKPSSTISWLIDEKARKQSNELKLADVADVTQLSTGKGCGWQFSTPARAWYKVVVPYKDTKKGYWKIHEQDLAPGSNLHQVTTGPNGQAVVLAYDDRLVSGPVVEQFNDTRYDAPGAGAPDVLRLPKLPGSTTSPTAMP